MSTILKPDTTEIIRFFDLATGQIVELRTLNVQQGGPGFPRTSSVHFSDLTKLVAEVAKHIMEKGVCILFNRVNADLLTQRTGFAPSERIPLTTDADITATWQPINLDPLRPGVNLGYRREG